MGLFYYRKKTKDTKYEENNEEYETVKSNDYSHMQACEPYGLHKTTSHNTQEPEYYNLRYDNNYTPS